MNSAVDYVGEWPAERQAAISTRRTWLRKAWLAIVIASLCAGAAYAVHAYRHRLVGRTGAKPVYAALILASAKSQIGTKYDGSYHVIGYPNGDIPPHTGACTDIVIRALRSAGTDLQQQVHEDMAANRSAYPRYGGKPLDTSIDHRRVPNLARYFSRHAQSLTREVSSSTLSEWQPGDIVCWKTIFGRDHIGLVSDGVDSEGTPFIIHNEYGCVEENCLTRWRIVGHYRVTELPGH